MRKRLDQVCPTAVVHWQANAMQQRPQLAMYISYAIAASSYVEATLGNFLTLVAENNAAAVAIYTNSRMVSQQQDDVRAVAKALFSADDFVLANVVLDLVRKVFEDRNVLAHSLWGYSDQIPDGIIAVNPGYYLIENFRVSSGDQVAARFDKQSYNEMWVYKEEDLLELIQRIESLWSYVPMLVALKSKDAAQRQAVWDTFKTFPEIRDKLPKSPTSP